MKYIKLYTSLMLILFFMASCSNNDTATSDAIVNLPTATMTVKENAGIFDVPVKVTGVHDNTIKATIIATAATTNGAIEDTNYYITSKTVIIPAGVDSVDIEIKAVDDTEINEDRVFTVTLSKVEGAKMGENTSSVITLKDNDANFYEKFAGKWTFNATNNKGATVSYPMTITCANEGEIDYDKTLTGSFTYSFSGISPSVVFPITYSYNKSTKTGYLGIQCNEDNVVCTYGSSYKWVFLLYNPAIDENNLIDGELAGTWSSDFNTCTFDSNSYIYFYQPNAGWWAYWTKISFVRSN